ncbi:helix-turn-helix domain-containing protein [Burkholderia cenocepacia]|uniref:helix-turn-helix domain-containing protein n=1 Tax=Burkholderia cenocepacia TaxID=95486 RepID=UPI001CF5227F|nr:helix-turn-helix domain-containing protein [Burkholderia cenocepacia]MCA8010211.1 helix-turn-helix domain-containing protein [Burkholderia cenocepacia]
MSKHIAQVAPRRASNALIRELLHQVNAIDADAAKHIARTHLRRNLPQVLNKHWDGLISDDEFAQTYLASISVLVQHSARREARPPMTKVEFDLLCHCVITCETLRQVIERHWAFLGMLGGRGAIMDLTVKNGIAEYSQGTAHHMRDRIAMFADLAGIAANYRLFAWLIDLPFELVEVKMCYPPLISEEAVSFLVPFPITYGAEKTAFRFDSELLDRPVVRTPQELNRLLARFPFDVDDTRGPRVVLTERVRAVLIANMSVITKLQTERQVADALGISLATLKRRLKAEHTSFRKIRDVLLRNIAIDDLKGGVTSVEAIAGRLGFGDAASFRHAFKRWTGHAPTYYQRTEQRDLLELPQSPDGYPTERLSLHVAQHAAQEMGDIG